MEYQYRFINYPVSDSHKLWEAIEEGWEPVSHSNYFFHGVVFCNVMLRAPKDQY